MSISSTRTNRNLPSYPRLTSSCISSRGVKSFKRMDFPILRRLENGGCLKSYSVEHNGRLRKFYSITEKGKDRIREYLTDSVQFVDGVSIMKKYEEEEIYYRTDHHWTSRGAFAAYTAICKAYGLTPSDKNDFSVETVGGFYGTSYAKSCYCPQCLK